MWQQQLVSSPRLPLAQNCLVPSVASAELLLQSSHVTGSLYIQVTPVNIRTLRPKRLLLLARTAVNTPKLHMSTSNNIDAVYFWMPEDTPYGGLSHWYSAKMLDDVGNSFSTVEHYMMYHKALLFGDKSVAQDILSLHTPGEAKAAGRRVTGFDKDKWKTHREQIVFEGNLLKFSQHDKLKELLLETSNRPLVEASPEDKLWGIGFSAGDAAQHRDQWGQNLCGIAIERVRKKLQQS